jgi:hypothetical protein
MNEKNNLLIVMASFLLVSNSANSDPTPDKKRSSNILPSIFSSSERINSASSHEEDDIESKIDLMLKNYQDLNTEVKLSGNKKLIIKMQEISKMINQILVSDRNKNSPKKTDNINKLLFEISIKINTLKHAKAVLVSKNESEGESTIIDLSEDRIQDCIKDYYDEIKTIQIKLNSMSLNAIQKHNLDKLTFILKNKTFTINEQKTFKAKTH